MVLDSKLAGILSNFCLDIAKAYFVAAFVTPALSGLTNWWEILFVLIKGLLFVIIFLLASWYLARLEDQL
ncbi:hypothetical protein HYZ05_00895 [Candidatus Daviesbacteria bacterium]|nr:hypothetical protein [Candidatus Daviesbacteria bacterium]